MSDTIYKAQRYRDLGFAWRFKMAHPLTQWYSYSKYFQRRDVATAEWQDRSVIRRHAFATPPWKLHMHARLPRYEP